MFHFETQLKKLKHEVLRNVAILAHEDRLNDESLEKIPYEIIQGDKPTYRCCVYKERAILNERVKLAIGCLPDGDHPKSELINVNNNGQIVYIIEAACDRCPINKYNVTEACRGCIAHKCMEVCPANAMVKVGGKAYINQELCKECGLCKKACPYDAISEVMRPCKVSCPTGALDVNKEDRRAIIKEEDCINCGSCMSACPFGAISDKSYIVPVVKEVTKENSNIYAIVAPAIAGQFGPKVTMGQVRNAFKKVGFKDMYEAACGADAVTVHESKEFIERMEKGDKYMTNSCCPGFMSFIEKKYPDQIERISTTVSPMIATARFIKANNKDAKVIFVGPCVAKKSEASREELRGSVDYVLTFEEIVALMDAFNIDPENCEDILIDEASVFGRGFAAGGGLTAAIENYVGDSGVEVTFKPVKVSGVAEVKKAMTMAKAGRLAGNFIEGMMCEGGCIGGPATLLPQMKSKALLVRFNNQASKKAVLQNDKLEEFEKINLER
ncbi:4Fe-4S dicluster domain-containing protein [Clostridium sp. MSJ-4]|uniref:4Fe-4S dicluster domain-containing protein n=1 Tax=Clostridium simiarum TaxID=2841506 RepID=A0ABS6F0L8_9CLOT|nr:MULTISPECIES: 4Fe-4S dicluster domain-containing protein [Clostridium]MBU5592041.1 4Fe-4S dicluster domain-containing protein [Clostridium simiarum]